MTRAKVASLEVPEEFALGNGTYKEWRRTKGTVLLL